MVRKLLVNSDRKILGKADGKIYVITSAIVSGIDGVTEQNGYITIGAENTDTDINVYSNKTINIFANVTVKMPTSSGAVSAYNLEPQNIKKGVTILGVTGTYEGE